MLRSTYRISYGKTVSTCSQSNDKKDYDVIVELINTTYDYREYRIIKVPDKISDIELAEICNKGIVPRGFSKGYKTIKIYID
jgi:hypothetical protein